MAKILVVDDALFMRKMLIDILTKCGHEVIAEASNGKEALSMYKDKKPDLVTMDITMPEVDGIQGLKDIREFDSNALVVMCSAMGQQSMVIESISNGAKDFIVKPFQAGRVQEAIDKVLKHVS